MLSLQQHCCTVPSAHFTPCMCVAYDTATSGSYTSMPVLTPVFREASVLHIYTYITPTPHISCTFLWGVQRAVGRMLINADDIKQPACDSLHVRHAGGHMRDHRRR